VGLVWSAYYCLRSHLGVRGLQRCCWHYHWHHHWESISVLGGLHHLWFAKGGGSGWGLREVMIHHFCSHISVHSCCPHCRHLHCSQHWHCHQHCHLAVCCFLQQHRADAGFQHIKVDAVWWWCDGQGRWRQRCCVGWVWRWGCWWLSC